jgi:hypothetical protein
MTSPTPAVVSLAQSPARTARALIVQDAALWVCVRCGAFCCSDCGAIHACHRCGARYSVHVPENGAATTT